MAKLQKMLHKIDGEDDLIEIVHIVNNIQMGGEFTLCCCAIPDSTLETTDFKQIGEEFDGKLGECTCQNCLNLVYFCKTMN